MLAKESMVNHMPDDLLVCCLGDLVHELKYNVL